MKPTVSTWTTPEGFLARRSITDGPEGRKDRTEYFPSHRSILWASPWLLAPLRALLRRYGRLEEADVLQVLAVDPPRPRMLQDGSWELKPFDLYNHARRILAPRKTVPLPTDIPARFLTPAGDLSALAAEVLVFVASRKGGPLAERAVRRHFEALAEGSLSCAALARREGLCPRAVQRALLRVCASIACEESLRERYESYVAKAACR